LLASGLSWPQFGQYGIVSHLLVETSGPSGSVSTCDAEFRC
jgi:hypothetical protein